MALDSNAMTELIRHDREFLGAEQFDASKSAGDIESREGQQRFHGTFVEDIK